MTDLFGVCTAAGCEGKSKDLNAKDRSCDEHQVRHEFMNELRMEALSLPVHSGSLKLIQL